LAIAYQSCSGPDGDAAIPLGERASYGHSGGPDDAQVNNQLGKLHFELNEMEAAPQWFERAVVLNPHDSDSIYWTGSIKQKLGEIEAAEVAYAHAAKIQSLIRRPATKFPADFRVLALFAPFAGNTPTEYLLKNSAYDTDTFAVFPSCEYDVELLKGDVDVVLNLISDADQRKHCCRWPSISLADSANPWSTMPGAYSGPLVRQ